MLSAYLRGILENQSAYQLGGNDDQKYGGVQLISDGGRYWHPKDYTPHWQFIATDVETMGCNPKEQSPVHHAQIHSFSIAYFEENPPVGLRGQPLAKRVFFYGKPVGLCAEALADGRIGKAMHQSHYDCQSYLNAGLDVRCCIDSLRVSRLLAPNEKHHGLKHLMQRDLGYQLIDYDELFSCPRLTSTGKEHAVQRDRIELDQFSMFSYLGCALADYASLDSKGTLEEIVVLTRRLLERKTYRLPEYVSYYYGIEPGWTAILRRFAGAV